jgi:dienelactone hydrolase
VSDGVSDVREVRIPAGAVTLDGDLVIPGRALGTVLFAHGSGSGRHSTRNRSVAQALQRGGLATLLLDLLTREEEELDLRTRHLRFDIGLLAERLLAATDWLGAQPHTSALRVGYFGASTGGGAALVAAARSARGGIDGTTAGTERVAAVVSRGGRPDLAGAALAHVRAPTLLIVGGDDHPVIEMNEAAFDRLTCLKRFEIVPGATHLFEEPGALEAVARLALDWFTRHLPATDRAEQAAA